MASVPTRDKTGRPMLPSPALASSPRSASAKTDNWAKLTAGVSGIRRISRFPIDGLRTTIAGTVDDVYTDYMPPAELSERSRFLAGEEAVAQSGIGSKGHFPGPLFLAPPPLEIEWPIVSRWPSWPRPAGTDIDVNYPDLMRVAARIRSSRHGTFESAASSANISPSISAPRARRSR